MNTDTDTDAFVLAVGRLKSRLSGLDSLEEIAEQAEANPESEVYRVAALEAAQWARLRCWSFPYNAAARKLIDRLDARAGGRLPRWFATPVGDPAIW